MGGPGMYAKVEARFDHAPQLDHVPQQDHAPQEARPLLVDYPHVARCDDCGHYAAGCLPEWAPRDVLIATLTRHESGHRYDPLTATSQHFSIHA
jgi:hypothetical protein